MTHNDQSIATVSKYNSTLLAIAIAMVGCAAETTGSTEAALDTANGLHVETFDDGSRGGWTIGSIRGDTVPRAGGNPGPYLRDSGQQTPAPAPWTRMRPFTGDYAGDGVSAVAIDLVLHQWVLPPLGHPNIHAWMWNDAETPGDPSDDFAVIRDTGALAPDADGVWQSYWVDVPAESKTLPEGWVAYHAGTLVTGPEADEVWKLVMADVNELGWSYGGPFTPNRFSLNESGIDNAVIVRRR